MSDLAAAAVDEQFVEVLEGKIGEALADMMETPSPAPPDLTEPPGDATPAELVDAAIAEIDEALDIVKRMAHSRQITDRLLEGNALAPTEVIPSVQRAPGLDAIATAAQRLVKRMNREITSASTTAWRISLPVLENRIATRLEEAGLSPATALRTAATVAADVRGEAAVAEQFIRTRVTDSAEADVARNLLPRIAKIMKELSHG